MENYPKLILGLDISTTCIGISILYDDGKNEPQVEMISHVSPKIDKKIKGIEALILRKDIFERDFLFRMDDILKNLQCPLKKITDCIIEAPLVYASAGSNAQTVSQLNQFNALLSEGVYKTLGLIPEYISSYDARMISFPELLSIRKFNKRGEMYPIKHIESALKKNHLILFGEYPFDCDKKTIMMNMVNEKYPNIPWLYNAKGELKKENYDSCDALICALAYSNMKRCGELTAEIADYNIYSCATVNGEDLYSKHEIVYDVKVWDRVYHKKLVIESGEEMPPHYIQVEPLKEGEAIHIYSQK